jgi:hypothetical protein
MRRILIERARKKSARKHGGGLQRVDLDQVDIALDTDDDLLLLLNDALEEFREKDPTATELIKLPKSGSDHDILYCSNHLATFRPCFLRLRTNFGPVFSSLTNYSV